MFATTINSPENGLVPFVRLHDAQSNIGLWHSIVDKYINHLTGFFFISQIIFDYIFYHGWFELPLEMLIKNTLQTFVL